MATQILEILTETVTYEDNYPEISGYGNLATFRVVMEDGDRKTAVVYIGHQPYLPEQLQDFLNKAAAFIENNAR